MIKDQFKIFDGTMSFEGGMDGGSVPSQIKPNQVSYAQNVTFRNGFAETRPKFMDVDLKWYPKIYTITSAAGTATVTTYSDHSLTTGDTITVELAIQPEYNGDHVITVTSDTTFTFTVTGAPASPATGNFRCHSHSNHAFESGKFQKASYYRHNDEYLITSVGGRVFRIDPITGRSIELTTTRTLGQYTKVCMVQADMWLVISDGEVLPFLYDGGTFRQSTGSTNNEVQPFTSGAFVNGRLWIGFRNEFIAGDIAGGPTQVYQFTENTYLNEGGSFSLPSEYGNITAMRLNSVQDAAAGFGELLVFSANSVNAVAVPVDRDSWKNLTYPLQRVSLFNYGTLGEASVTTVNGDLYFRSRDGVRSYYQAQRQFGVYGNTPISNEIAPVIDNDAEQFLDHCSAVVFDGRMLMTAGPIPLPNGFYHRGLIVLDFSPLAGIGEKKPPVWDGVWTGIRPTQLVVGVFNDQERCYAFCYDTTTHKNKLVEITKEQGDDNDSTAISAWVETKSYQFDKPASIKTLETADLWLDNIWGEVSFTVRFRPDQYPCWQAWSSWIECATKCDTTFSTCTTDITTYKPQYRPRIRLPLPTDAAETTTNKPFNRGYEFQMRIEWSGVARLKLLRVHARESIEDSVGACPTSSSCVGETCTVCNLYDF